MTTQLNTTGVYPPYPGTPLRVGSRGTNVSTMQSYLNSISTNLYPQIPQLVVDGIFGSRTQQAVLIFQRLLGLVADGIIGPVTWNNIVTQYNSGGGVTPPYPGTLLRLGSRGTNVATMQRYLNSIASRFFPQIPQLVVDGIFGSKTRQAVLIFQGLSGLSADGIIGPLTWNAIVIKYNSGGGGVDPPYPGTILELGSRGSNVLLMQQYLEYIRANWYPQLPTLVADGIFGQRTRSAVVLYQQLEALTADGKIGQNTWNSIVLLYNALVGGGD